MLGFSINIPVHLSNTHGDRAMPKGHLARSVACRSCLLSLGQNASGRAKAGALSGPFQSPGAAFISVSQRSQPSPAEKNLFYC